jgi:hypothetical protein
VIRCKLVGLAEKLVGSDCMDLEWITPEEAGNKWGIKTRQVQALCADGKIKGAVRVSRVWLIPKDATKPPDGRMRTVRKKK